MTHNYNLSRVDEKPTDEQINVFLNDHIEWNIFPVVYYHVSLKVYRFWIFASQGQIKFSLSGTDMIVNNTSDSYKLLQHTGTTSTSTATSWGSRDMITTDVGSPNDGSVYSQSNKTVGSQLTEPEYGWKRYDDTHDYIEYKGSGWVDTTDSSFHNNTAKALQNENVGSKINFLFRGTRLRILVASTSNYTDKVKIKIDGEEEYFSVKHSSTTLTGQLLMYEKVGLTNKIHNIEIEHVKDGNTSSYSFRLDAIDIDEGGELLHPDYTLNKTLIQFSSNGEYKKCDEGSPAVIGDTNAIPAMTSNTEPSGVASSSNQHLTNDPYRAFDKSSDVWIGVVDGSDLWIQYDFRKKQKIESYSITTRNNAMYARFPKSWILQGSNDGLVWNNLHEVEDVELTINTTYKYNLSRVEEYRIYRILITQTVDGQYVALADFSLYQPDAPEIPPSWQTISTTLPTLQQFQEHGMEDLSVFDRKHTTFTQGMIEDGQLGEGKVFKSTVDLKKYFDIVQIKMK